jgi:hypothetical protein
MPRRRILKSLGTVALPSMLMLSGCPQECAPPVTPSDQATEASPQQASDTARPAAPAPPANAAAPPAASPPAVTFPPTPTPAGAQFAATFDSPSEFSSRFVTSVGNYVDAAGQRVGDLVDCCPWIDTPRSFPGDHNASCDAPTTQRTIDVHNIQDFFWYCAPGGDAAKGHVMSAFDGTGYTILAFSPNQTMTNVRQVCWDVNATEEGGGKWTNMIVVPEATYRQFAPRMDYVTEGFNAPNAPGDFNIQAGDHPGSSVWGLKDFRGTLRLFQGDDTLWYSGDQSFTTSDKAARYRKCVTETSPGRLTITAQRPTGALSTYQVAGSFPDGPVRVIFQDDMYDPPKREGYNPNNVTWHWDNITIS